MKPGDFVVLIDDKWDTNRPDRMRGVVYPERGPVYTVRDVAKSLTNPSEPALRVEEIVNPVLRYRFPSQGPDVTMERRFLARRFRVLDRLTPAAFMRELEVA